MNNLNLEDLLNHDVYINKILSLVCSKYDMTEEEVFEEKLDEVFELLYIEYINVRAELAKYTFMKNTEGMRSMTELERRLYNNFIEEEFKPTGVKLYNLEEEE